VICTILGYLVGSYWHRYCEFSVDVRRSEAVTLRQPVMPVFDSFAG
jgi:hypothetical protein